MRKILFILFSLLVFKGAIMAVEMKSLEINGVKIPVIYEQNKALPLFYLQFVFKGGGAIRNGDALGISELVSSILNEGTKRLGVTKFSQKLEEKALSLSAGSGVETLSITLSGMSEYKKDGIDALKELLNDPNFTQSTLDKVKENTLISILEKENDFDYQARSALYKTLFKGSALEFPLIGTKESLEKIKLKDIEKFYKDSINLESLIIVAGGDLEFDALKNSLAFLGNLQSGKTIKIPTISASDAKEYTSLNKDTQQAYVYFGAPLIVGDLQKEAALIKVASFVLGGSGFGSRILEEVRVKRGLAYSATMRLEARDSRSFAFGYLQTSLKNQKEAQELVKVVVNDFVKNGITQDELDEAKRYLLGSEPLRNETLSQRLGSAFLNYYDNLPLDFQKQLLDEIANLKLESINAYIKKHTEITKLSFGVVTKAEQ